MCFIISFLNIWATSQIHFKILPNLAQFCLTGDKDWDSSSKNPLKIIITEMYSQNMRKEVIAFCFFTAILILGLLIMIKPHYFVSYFPNEQSMLNQRVGENNIPKEIIWIASLLIVIGLVGLAILGFRLFEDLQDEANTNAND